MFWENYVNLCNNVSKSPNKAASEIGYSSASVTKWKSGAIPRSTTLKKIADYFGVSPNDLISSAPKEGYVKKGVIKAPVLGYVAAGIPIEAIEDVLDYEELSTEEYDENFEYFALKIKGDSMSPRIQSGDIVIVRRQPTVESGEIAIVSVDREEATCKKVRFCETGIELISLNENYKPMFFTAKEAVEKSITILGKVVELRGKL